MTQAPSFDSHLGSKLRKEGKQNDHIHNFLPFGFRLTITQDRWSEREALVEALYEALVTEYLVQVGACHL